MIAHGSVCVLIRAHVCAVSVNCAHCIPLRQSVFLNLVLPHPFFKEWTSKHPHPLSSHNSGAARVHVTMTRLTFACQGTELRSSQLHTRSRILLPSLAHNSRISRWDDKNDVIDVGGTILSSWAAFPERTWMARLLCLTEANSRRKKKKT